MRMELDGGLGPGLGYSGEAGTTWRLGSATPANDGEIWRAEHDAGREREERESLGESGREGAELGRSTYREGRGEKETPGEVKGSQQLHQSTINGAGYTFD
jgi:hypothetical protein